MNRRDLLVLAAGALVLRPAAASLAEQARMTTIGALIPGSHFDGAIGDFRQSLRDLGYVEGQHIQLEIRSADDDLERLPGLAAALVRGRVDIIVAISTPAALAAKDATTAIPIVVAVADPIGSGIVSSLAHPGGNVTGMSAVNAELGGKLVELLGEVIPNLGRIAALLNAADPFSARLLEEIGTVADALRIKITPSRVKPGPELDAAIPAMLADSAEAVIVQGSLPLEHVADLMIRYRLPACAPDRLFARIGGLLAYSPAEGEVMRGVAALVQKVMMGVKPADLPVQQPTRFDLSINLKTAKMLGLTMPQALVQRADEVIE
jgi:putative ABC transport system substrate-binding protein